MQRECSIIDDIISDSAFPSCRAAKSTLFPRCYPPDERCFDAVLYRLCFGKRVRQSLQMIQYVSCWTLNTQ